MPAAHGPPFSPFIKEHPVYILELGPGSAFMAQVELPTPSLASCTALKKLRMLKKWTCPSKKTLTETHAYSN